mgnify:CR=1 FL=1
METPFEKLPITNIDVPHTELNPRKKELDSKPWENLSNEEQAELMGLRVFPDNPRGAELRRKEALGLVTEDEKKELRRLYQLQTRDKKMTPAIRQLWERTEANDPHVEQVNMGSGKSIEVSSTEDTEKVIWTFGLDGCAGVAVFTENEEGTRDCVLTHYPPTELSINMAKLRELISQSVKMKAAKNKQVVLIMPGEYTQDLQTKRWEMRIKNQSTVNILSLAVQAELGANVPIKLEPYSENISVDEKDQGVFAVYIPPAGKGDARYQTWFSSGKLGVSPKEK